MGELEQQEAKVQIASDEFQRELPTWPKYEADEIDAARAVLESGKVNYWTGQQCKKFEQEFAAFHGARYGIALANGTVALELAFRALGLGDGDEVIVTPRSYFASASSVVLSGAKPVFADVDRNSGNITVDSIRQAITPRTRAIVAVHLAGWPCDMLAIMDLAREHKLKVVEDCAQAHGASFKGRRVGSFGDLAAFSFCQDKIMTTAGEGGMLLTNDCDLWAAAWSFKDHGKSYASVHSSDHAPGFRWVHESFGSNLRLTELQAAIGRLQLRKLPDWLTQRRRNAARLTVALEDLPVVRLPRPSTDEHHAYYRYYAFMNPERTRPGWSRDRVLSEFDAVGIPGLSGTCPEIYRENAFAAAKISTLSVARELGETSITFMVHPTLQTADIDYLASKARKVLKAASR